MADKSSTETASHASEAPAQDSNSFDSRPVSVDDICGAIQTLNSPEGSTFSQIKTYLLQSNERFQNTNPRQLGDDIKLAMARGIHRGSLVRARQGLRFKIACTVDNVPPRRKRRSSKKKSSSRRKASAHRRQRSARRVRNKSRSAKRRRSRGRKSRR